MADKNFGERSISFTAFTVLDAGESLHSPHSRMSVLMPKPDEKLNGRGLHLDKQGLIRSDADKWLANYESLREGKSTLYRDAFWIQRWKFIAGSIVMARGSQKDVKRNVWRWTDIVQDRTQKWFREATPQDGESVWGALALCGVQVTRGDPLMMPRRTADTFLQLFFSAYCNFGMEWRSL